ncbi:hypothetical protein F885_00004 [Acinetobacter higginsii]|uniref:hypothetical protein n=1 Tax=Acinetobacter higginsii TaxID=70347 RepID=UPI0002CEB74B|nr:hypothetical protein [Acinetobacter higginsii]ENX64728.1 hypothetical protein F885_00004 [Acinetobacter higginsii]
MIKVIAGVLLIASTSTLAAKAEYRFYIKYNIENKRIISIKAEKNTPADIQEKCTEELLKGNASKLLEGAAKGKIGTVNLTYFCSR